MEKNKEDEASNSPACAACRHQRKQCKAKECVIWPHFPSDRMEEFLAVQRVFGIANVTKMMRELGNDERAAAAAAASLLWEAKSWTEDPVHGPLRKFNRLEQELNALKASVFQYQPAAMDAAVNTSLVPMGDNNILPQEVKESLVISNGGFPHPYPANFGHQWPSASPEIIASSLQLPQQQPPTINPPIPGLIRGDEYVGTMYSAPSDLPVRDIDDFLGTIFSGPPIRGEENGGTIFSTSPSLLIRGEDDVGTSLNRLSRCDVRGEENGGTIFSTSPNLPIRREDSIGTSFNSLSGFNVRGDEDNVRTQCTSSVNLPVKRDGDPPAFSQQHSRNSNPRDVRVSRQYRK